MTITDESRFHLHQRLAEVLGQEEASTLMEHLPPVGWADVATRRDLDHAFTHLEATFDRQLALQRSEFTDRFGQIDGHLGRLDGRIDGLGRRVDGLEARLDSRFNEFEAKLDAKLDARLSGVQADLSRQMLTTTLAGNSVLVALVFGITRLLG